MIGEETFADQQPASDVADTTSPFWVIDPIDGTTNYLRGIPAWGISIAYHDSNGSLTALIVIQRCKKPTPPSLVKGPF